LYGLRAKTRVGGIKMFDTFIDFNGVETEREFLEKCLEQWDLTVDKKGTDTNKLLEIGSVFREIRHRVDELR